MIYAERLSHLLLVCLCLFKAIKHLTAIPSEDLFRLRRVPDFERRDKLEIISAPKYHPFGRRKNAITKPAKQLIIINCISSAPEKAIKPIN